ncbi:MAG: hypothetical protein WA081_00200 [Desulfosalsimonadaceae bacterium]
MMKNQDFEVRVMNYFAENTNLQKYWNIAKDCAKEICNLRFNNIISGEFEMPTHVDMKKKAAERIPYEFNASDFMQNGPIDFSGLDESRTTETLHKIESIYKKFHEAQAMAVARAAINLIEKLATNVRDEIDQVKNKYLS